MYQFASRYAAQESTIQAVFSSQMSVSETVKRSEFRITTQYSVRLKFEMEVHAISSRGRKSWRRHRSILLIDDACRCLVISIDALKPQPHSNAWPTSALLTAWIPSVSRLI
jgi:hypothetical protein